MPIGDSDPDILFKKGSDLVRNKKFDEALAVFDEVLLFDPSNDMAWVAKGVIFTHQQKFEDAVQSFNQALLINPTN
ncbi:MAG: tetratricopeptide repeat protein, partial [Methanoregula sp.]|nr:tetratricopeptide repeat protein [Methanoregula sp.]